MNFVISFIVAICFIGIQSAPSLPPLPVNPGGIGGLFRGPNLETIIKGPDGSQIVSEQIGGSVETANKLEPIVVPDQVVVSSVSSQPDVTSDEISVVSPVSIPLPPVSIPVPPVPIPVPPVSIPVPPPEITQNIQSQDEKLLIVDTAEEPHIIETRLIDAPEIEPEQNSDLKGPSGTILVRGSSSIVSGPASTTISEPVRKIPIANIPIQQVLPISAESIPLQHDNSRVPQLQSVSVPIQPPLPVQQEPLAIQQEPLPIQQEPLPIQQVPLQIQQVPFPIQSVPLPTQQVQTASSVSQPQLRLEPIQPAISHQQTQTSSLQSNSQTLISLQGTSNIGTPIISLSDTAGAGIADAASPSSLFIPSTASPISIAVSSTPVPISVSPSIDIESSRIDLGTDVITSQGIPNRSLLPPVEKNEGNQIVSINSGYVSIDGRDMISPPQPSASFNGQNQEGYSVTPIASLLDTVFVQPTDPKNREIIEFGGRKLENVGNIVPVIRSPVIVTSNLNNIQQIPTASVSQLAANELNYSQRYQRQLKN